MRASKTGKTVKALLIEEKGWSKIALSEAKAGDEVIPNEMLSPDL